MSRAKNIGNTMDLSGVPESQIDWAEVMGFLDSGGSVVGGPEGENGKKPQGMITHQRKEMMEMLTTSSTVETEDGGVIHRSGGFMSWCPAWFRKPK